MPRLTSVKRKKFEKFLEYIGCKFKRQKGDHLIYDRPGLDRPVVITTDREVPMLHIRTNLKTLKMNIEEFIEILRKL